MIDRTRDACKHMTTVTLNDGRTVMLDKLAECEEALRSVEAANERLLRQAHGHCWHPVDRFPPHEECICGAVRSLT